MFHVPYRGVTPLVQDLMGGQVDISFLPLAGSVLSLIKDGKLRALGMAQAERNPLAPNIPTLGEIDPQLKRFDYPTWAGWLVKADTPDAEVRSEEHTSELQSLMRISYAVFCLKKKKRIQQ